MKNKTYKMYIASNDSINDSFLKESDFVDYFLANKDNEDLVTAEYEFTVHDDIPEDFVEEFAKSQLIYMAWHNAWDNESSYYVIMNTGDGSFIEY